MLDNPEIEAITEAIKKAVPTEQIFLFGSHAYGHPHIESDYDFFLVIPDGEMRLMDAVHCAYHAIPREVDRAVDVLANYRSDFNRMRHWKSTMERTVYQKGVLLYDRSGLARPMGQEGDGGFGQRQVSL